MNCGNRRALTPTLRALGIGCLFVLLSTGGCSRIRSVAAMVGIGRSESPRASETPVPPDAEAVAEAPPDAAPAPPPSVDQLVFEDAAPQAPPPKIDVFGEFDGQPRAFSQPVSGAGFQQHTYVDEGFDGDVAIDPAGKWIVFSSTRHSEKGDIYLQRVDGLSVTQLTSDPADDAFPSFSPDGKLVAFCSTRAGNWDIYVMDADGRNPTQVTSSPSQEIHPSFSPDGTKLVYCSMGSRSGQWEIWVADLLTSEKKMIGFGLFPSWSPDKSVNRIAFQRARQRGSRWFSLWTLDLIDGEARRVTEVAVSSNAAIVCPTWSPDGKRLAFATVVEPAKTSKGKPAGQTDIWTVNADGTNRHRLTDGHGTNATPYWAPDGRVYFISDRGGTECVWSVQAEGVSTFASKKPQPQPQGRPEGLGSTDLKELGN